MDEGQIELVSVEEDGGNMTDARTDRPLGLARRPDGEPGTSARRRAV